MEAGTHAGGEPRYPVEYSVEYPDRDLNRLTTAFRLIWVIPISIVLATLSGEHAAGYEYGQYWHFGAALGGGLFLGPLLMILFRQKYPRWWFDWNLELLRFQNRVGVYFALLDDRYPSTDEQQSSAPVVDDPLASASDSESSSEPTTTTEPPASTTTTTRSGGGTSGSR